MPLQSDGSQSCPVAGAVFKTVERPLVVGRFDFDWFPPNPSGFAEGWVTLRGHASLDFPRSSNGRTAAFGAVNRGSNPCRGASLDLARFPARKLGCHLPSVHSQPQSCQTVDAKRERSLLPSKPSSTRRNRAVGVFRPPCCSFEQPVHVSREFEQTNASFRVLPIGSPVHLDFRQSPGLLVAVFGKWNFHCARGRISYYAQRASAVLSTCPRETGPGTPRDKSFITAAAGTAAPP